MPTNYSILILDFVNLAWGKNKRAAQSSLISALKQKPTEFQNQWLSPFLLAANHANQMYSDQVPVATVFIFFIIEMLHN